MEPFRVDAPEGIRVRPAASEDCDALLALYCEVHDAHLEAHPDEFEALSPEDEGKLLQQFARTDGARLLVAESARGPVGCVRFELQDFGRGGRRRRPRLYVNLLVVAPKWQARGVGSLLLEHVHAFARTHGAEAIELDVHEFNAIARRLYDRLGYQTVMRRMKLRLGRG
ncbi:MAG TPA: GNAT family N-acetyltransferase [Casimicrobiaceae bacterium]|nr:GNAT family N-acetyltransferase [Casimicrobiaceae bacterium]